jgi:hypothetical protein
MLGGLIGDGEFQVTFGTNGSWLLNVNLRSIFDAQYPGVAASGPIRVVFTQRGHVGSAAYNAPALNTGSWVAGSDIVLVVPNANSYTASEGYIMGRGSSGCGGGASAAITLGTNLTIVNNGLIGGGGGGGADYGGPTGEGGGGAGYYGGGGCQGSGGGGLFSGGGGSGGSGAGGGLGKEGNPSGNKSWGGRSAPALIRNGYSYTFDAASTKPWFVGLPSGSRGRTSDPLIAVGDRNGFIQ